MKLKTIFFLSISISTITICSSICIPEQNCPYKSGYCKVDICECFPGYTTFINKTEINQVYCNYKQYSKWIPFIFELFIPSSGLIAIKRVMHGLIKLILFLLFCFRVSFTFILIFILMYTIDLICIFFKAYRDGNGVPLY